MANLDFDLSQTEAYGNYSLPDGSYNVKIIKDEIKTDQHNQRYLNLTYCVLDGPYAKAYQFDALYFWHDDPERRTWAKRKLKSIALAIHHPNPQYVGNSSELIGGEMVIKLKTKPSKKTGEPYQNISSYSQIQGGVASPEPTQAPAQPVQEQPQAQPSEAQNDSKFPWEN